MRKTLLAAAALTALAACSSTETGGAMADKLTVASVMSSLDAAPSTGLAPQTDYAMLFDAIPETARISVGAYAPEGSGAVARDVSISFGESGLGMTVNEMRAYGLDPAASEAFSAAPGTRARLADRLDLRGVSFTGFEAFAEKMSETLLDDIAAGIGGEVGEALGEAEIDQDTEGFTYTIDRMILDGATFAALPDVEDANFLQMYAQFYSAFGADRAVATGIESDFSMRQTVVMTDPETGEQSEVTGTSNGTTRIAEMGIADWRGGDIGLQFIRGMTTTSSGETDGVTQPPVAFTVAEMIGRDMRLSEVIGYIFAEQMPPAEATDILSLGKWDLTDLNISVADTPFHTIHQMSVDATQFHGLLPESITYSSTETFHLGGLVQMVADDPMAFADPGEEAPTAEEMAAMREIVASLRAQGLEAIRSENSGSYSWSPQSGAMALKMDSRTDEMGAILFGLDMMLPTHDQFAAVDLESDMAAMGEAEMGGGELGELMAEVAALDRMELVIDDEGGLDAFLAVMIAVAENMPAEDGDQSMAMLRGQTPEQFRQMLAGLVTMGSVQMAQAIPQVGDYAGALSAWLGQGGKLRLVIDPDSPLGAAAIAELQTMPGGPPAMIDRLGIEVTHSE